MTLMTHRWSRAAAVAALGLALAASCGKGDGGKAAGKAGGGDSPVAPAGGSGPFASWDLAGIAKKFEGVWIVDGAAIGTRAIWAVTGDHATLVDDKGDHATTFEVTSPCTVAMMEKHPDGSSEGVTSHFVWNGDKLYTGLGDAGIRKGGQVVACVSSGVFVLEGGACTRYSEMFGRWDKEAATCTIEGAAGAETLVIKDSRASTGSRSAATS